MQISEWIFTFFALELIDIEVLCSFFIFHGVSQPTTPIFVLHISCTKEIHGGKNTIKATVYSTSLQLHNENIDSKLIEELGCK